MPREESVTPSDLIGHVEWIVVECSKCPRRGRYRVAKLLADLGPDAKLTYWLSDITKDCPRKQAARFSDWCGVRCVDVPAKQKPRRISAGLCRVRAKGG